MGALCTPALCVIMLHVSSLLCEGFGGGVENLLLVISDNHG
jgi:hypothetical protein